MRRDMKKKLIMVIVAGISLVGGYWFYSLNNGVETIAVFGNVDIREVNISFRVPGFVKEMHFEEGDVVRAGTVVSVLDKQPYIERVNVAEAAVRSQQAALKNAQITYNRSKALVKTGAVSVRTYDNDLAALTQTEAALNSAKATLDLEKISLKDTEILTPSDGIVTTRVHEPGEYVQVGQPVYTLSLTSPLWVRTYVTEPQLGRIYPGMKAKIKTDSGFECEGQVGFISPQAEFTPKNVETQSLRTDLVYRLRIIVDNPRNTLRQGMPVTIILKPR